MDLRGDHEAASAQLGIEGGHPRWRDMEHVRFSRLRWPIGILDPDRAAIASTQPEHDALATALASFTQLGEGGMNQRRWAGYQHSAVSFLPGIPQLGKNAAERVARAVLQALPRVANMTRVCVVLSRPTHADERALGRRVRPRIKDACRIGRERREKHPIGSV